MLKPISFSFEEMDLHEGQILLANAMGISKPKEPSATITELLEELPFLPLAIAHAGAFLSISKMPVQDYIGILKKTEQDKIDMLSRRNPDKINKGQKDAVMTTWQISFDYIRRNNIHAAETLLFISRIEPKAIPIEALPLNGTESQLLISVTTLCSYAFLTLRENHVRVYNMHELVRLATRKWKGMDDWQVTFPKIMGREGERAKLLSFEDGFLSYMAWTFPTNDWQNRELWRKLLLHASCLLREYQGNALFQKWDLAGKVERCLLQDDRVEEAIARIEEHCHLADDQSIRSDELRLQSNIKLLDGYLKAGRAHSTEAQITLALVQELAELQEDDHPRLCSQTGIARYFWETEEKGKALQLFKHIHEKQQKILANDHDHLMYVGFHLARAYMSGSENQNAVKLLKNLIPIFTQKNGADNPDVLSAEHLLASAEYAIDGQSDQTIQKLERIVDEFRNIHDEGHALRISTENHLATMYRTVGRVTEAATLLEDLVETYRKTAAPNNSGWIKAEKDLKRLQKLQAEHNDREDIRLLGESA